MLFKLLRPQLWLKKKLPALAAESDLEKLHVIVVILASFRLFKSSLKTKGPGHEAQNVPHSYSKSWC